MTTIPRGPDAGTALGPFVRAIRSHAMVFALVTLATLVAAAALLTTRAPTYEATTELLVTPLAQDDRTFLGIPLLRDSGDPTRTVQTAAALIASPVVAQRTAQALGGAVTRQGIEDAVTVEPLGESNIVGVTALAGSASEAASIADGYAREALALRAELLGRQVVAAIAELRGVAERNDGELSTVDRTRLTELRAVRDRGDPSLSLSQPAQLPAAPTDAPVWLVLALALVAGLTLAAIVAVLIERLDRRVRDIDDLVSLAPIAVLARVPAVRRRAIRRPGIDVPPAVRESFRTLQIQTDQRRSGDRRPGRTIVVTSASSADGKTTTAICLAVALGAAGHEVILIDGDMRRPDVGPQLGLSTATGLGSLLTSPARLDHVLQRIDRYPKLRVLTTDRAAGGDASMALLTGRLPELLAEAAAIADYVIIDTAPLGIVGDALAVTQHADELLFVGRIGNTDRRAAADAFELLWRADTPPTGWVVIGAAPVRRSDAHYYAATDAPDRRRRLRSPVG